MLRFGLCCAFVEQPIKFRVATAFHIEKLPRDQALLKLSTICRDNASSLLKALAFCREHGIGCFRINSQIMPLRTHPGVGYQAEDLPAAGEIVEAFQACGEYAARHRLRLSFHPDQFIVLSSPSEQVRRSSLLEIEYQAQVAEWVGADVINVHGGGAYGDKAAALDRFRRSVELLSPRARKRLTVENDDKVYTPADLLPLCRIEGIPLVYDVHHHRCLSDGQSEQDVTEQALATWDREPIFHISSPLEGWGGPNAERHHDFIDVRDFPDCWRRLDVTVEVEAKKKELAVVKLIRDLRKGISKPTGKHSRRL